MDVPFDDGEGRIVPEATAVWLVEVAASTAGVEASTWLVVSVATTMVSVEDAAEETVDDADEAPPEGANVAVSPQSSAAAPTWSP